MSIETPSSPSPEELTSIVDTLLARRRRRLVRRPVHDILAVIDRCIRRWLDPDSDERRQAEAQLPATTGLSPPMLRHVLPLVFEEYRGERLGALLDAELGGRDSLDRAVASNEGNRRAIGPGLSVHVLAGNLPGAGLDGVIFSLLVKSAVLIKAASTEPVLPDLFARSLAAVDPELGACLHVVHWPGGRADLEKAAFGRADLVVASGSDVSLASIRERLGADTRFIGYGHKLSFGLVTRAGLADCGALAHWSRAAAYDAAVYDQLGCLSPQLVYVEEGGPVSPREFASALADDLAEWQITLPRGAVPTEAGIAVRRLRDRAEWQALAGKDVELHASRSGLHWTVIYEADPTFAPSPLYRTVRVKPLRGPTHLAELLADWRPHLEAVGLAADSDESARLGELLAGLGVSRVCPLGKMQRPPLNWRRGGRPRIGAFLRWTGSPPTTEKNIPSPFEGEG